MKVFKRTVLLLIITTILTLLVASTAQAAVRIYEGKGVGKARLKMVDSTAAKYLGSHTVRKKDTRYANHVWYVIYFGKNSGSRFPLEMESDSHHKVFQFICNSSKYVTAKGIKAGSTEKLLKAKYGSSLKRLVSSVYIYYTIGKHPYTRFYVKRTTHKVLMIAIVK